MDIASGQLYPDRIAQTINDCMDLGRQSTLTASYFLFEVPPFAPVPCWWTLTKEPSIMMASKSASCDNS